MLLGTCLYYNNGWVQINAQRFSLDYLPLLIVLTALGMHEVSAKFWKPAIIFAVAMNAFCFWIKLPPQTRKLF